MLAVLGTMPAANDTRACVSRVRLCGRSRWLRVVTCWRSQSATGPSSGATKTTSDNRSDLAEVIKPW